MFDGFKCDFLMFVDVFDVVVKVEDDDFVVDISRFARALSVSLRVEL